MSFVTGDSERFQYDDGYPLEPGHEAEGDVLRGSAVVALDGGGYLMVYTADIPF